MKQRAIALFPLLFAVLLHLIPGEYKAQAGCASILATGPTGICPGKCVTLGALIQGTAGTSVYAVGVIPYTPFPFVGSTVVLLGVDDQYSSTIPMPFSFSFYGSPVSKLVIGCNGNISFDTTQAGGYDPWNQSSGVAPNSSYPGRIMCPFYDIDPALGGTISYALYGTAPCRQLVISWSNIPLFSCTTMTGTQQMVLNETTNYIDMYILSKPDCPNWNSGAGILGIQNLTATLATTVPGRNGGAWYANNEGWRFTPSGPSMYTVVWAQDTTQLGTGSSVQVCPSATTTYTATLTNTDANGNTTISTSMVTVTMGTGLPVTITPSASVICSGDQVTLTASGGVTYTWSPALTLSDSTGNTVIASPTTSTTYTVTGDTTGCSGTSTALITIGCPTISVSATPSTCGHPDGSATVVTNGTCPLTYSWSSNPPQTTATATALPSGTYTVTASGAGGCVRTGVVRILNSNSPVLSTSSVNPYACISQPGSATVNVSSGTPPFTYSWSTSPVQTGATATGLGTGYCMVTVTDSLGCSAHDSVVLSQTPALTSYLTAHPVTCAGMTDGNILASVFQGIAPYTCTWNTIPVQVGLLLNNLGPGWYTATITDAAGCQVQDSIQITQPLPLTQDSLTHTLITCSGCTDASATIYPSGGTAPYSYAWDSNPPQSGQTATNLGPGTYHVCITDQEHCTHCDSIRVDNALGIQELYNGGCMLETFPNPSSGNVTLLMRSLSGTQEVCLKLMNLLGQEISSSTFLLNASVTVRTYDLSAYAKGMYLIQLSGNSQTVVHKFLIQ